MRDASKTGGALGQIAVQELNFLQSVLGSLAIGQSTEQLKQNLAEIKQSVERWNNTSQETSQTTPGLNDSLRSEWEKQGITEDFDESLQLYGEDTIREILGFSGDLGTSLNGQNDVKKIAEAIKEVESGGNYQAKGGSGESGAYQFMPATWDAWSKQYLGYVAPMTQENQDKVAEAKINDLLNQGYSAKEIALIWNGGSTQIKSGTNKYGVKYDTGAYAEKVLNALNKSG
ncbi:MAG TPA: hypothetical protein DEH15_19380 [Marinilabiliales bacterium]|nr:hypothetical protein [Marinilabiliales bacterium]